MATAGVLAVTAVVTLAGALWPGVEDALRRMPGALADGEVWRAVTPLLVHPEGWLQVAVDLTGIALVGLAASRAFGPWRFLAAYLVTGTVGHLAGAAWDPHSAGSSVAVLGTAGALVAWQARRREEPDPPASLYALAVLAALLGAHLGSLAAGALPAVVAGTAVQTRRLAPDRQAHVAAAVLAVLGIALTAAGDIHGPPVVAGLLLGWVAASRAAGAGAGAGSEASDVRTGSSSTGPEGR